MVQKRESHDGTGNSFASRERRLGPPLGVTVGAHLSLFFSFFFFFVMLYLRRTSCLTQLLREVLPRPVGRVATCHETAADLQADSGRIGATNGFSGLGSSWLPWNGGAGPGVCGTGRLRAEREGGREKKKGN